ncbi:hypothetical protein BX070DRAFT_37661 [Coemansia spiralis]|nr:hypothetical protein BX070DRAFT_37661 [Coemansia spiralis]
MSAICKEQTGGDDICHGYCPLIEDFNCDSSGSLTSLDYLETDLSDCSNATEKPSEAAPLHTEFHASTIVAEPIIKRKEKRPKKSCADIVAPTSAKKSIVPLPACHSFEDIITTGAFLTRATLRKLGVASSLVDPETLDSGLGVGNRVKVLSLDKRWYIAVVLAIAAGKVLVHYPSWDHSYNEWVAIDSRRLIYREKQGLTDRDDAREVFLQLDDLDSSSNFPELDRFDLQRAIKEALGTASEDIQDENECNDVANGAFLAESVIDDGNKPDKADQNLKHARGRPQGSRNRKRAGHIKRRAHRPPQKAVKAAESEVQQTLADTASNAVVVAPEVPKEMRISEVRFLSNTNNPYAKRPRAEDMFESDSDEPACQYKAKAVDSRNCEKITADNELPSKRSKAVDNRPSGSQPKDNAIWELTRGPYVTTGAFFTRRTIKSLTLSESTGGIMKDHHGYYPGQLVEVMNANRTWYTGRVISYANKKFLVNYVGWPHSHNEWIPAGSKRMRTATDLQMDNATELQSMETEDDARRICAVLVDEYNAYIDALEKEKAEKESLKRQKKQTRKIPVNTRIVKPTERAVTDDVNKAEANSATAGQAEDYEDIDSSVEPISVDFEYTPVPQLLRVKDYTKLYKRGMLVAARDRNKLWWKAQIVDIKTFRLRIHYIGFPSAWDEWMEMNTQRIMIHKTFDYTVDDGLSDHQDNALDLDHGSASDDEDNLQPDHDVLYDSKAEESDRCDGGDSVGTGRFNRLEKHTPVVVRPTKRIGRPPGPETKSAPLSLRLALKASMSDHIMHEQCHPEDIGIFHLPKEHMTVREYSIFLKVGDKVRIRDRSKQWQECMIVDFKHGNIRICYDGFSDEYNQWIPVNSDRIKILRKTIESDGRLEKLEKESRIALRRKREKMRAQRRKTKQAALASLVCLAESLEYIVDRTELRRLTNAKKLDSNLAASPEVTTLVENDFSDPEDMPLLCRLIETDSDVADSIPLITRLQLNQNLGTHRSPSIKQHGQKANTIDDDCMLDDSPTWFVYCNQCSIVIRTFRYYCTECEKPSDGYDYESFDMCLVCFSKGFPAEHPHPQTSFARAAVGDAESIVEFTKQMLAKYQRMYQQNASKDSVDTFAGILDVYEPDTFDTSYTHVIQDNSLWKRLAIGLHGTTASTGAIAKPAIFGKVVGLSNRSRIISSIDSTSDEDTSNGQKHNAGTSRQSNSKKSSVEQYLSPHELLPRCAFCGDDDPDENGLLGGFIENCPLILTSTREDGVIRRRRFWAHVACAKYSPEVLTSSSGRWYNVAAALRRARTIKCAKCKKRGATIGCFYERCQKSYHVSCTGMPKSFFESGRTFWCARHARVVKGFSVPDNERAARDTSGDNNVAMVLPKCASCNHELTSDLMWMVCLECSPDPLQQFNICLTCYESKDALATHPHKKRCFREHMSQNSGNAAGHIQTRLNKKTTNCHYCRSRQSRRWRKGYGGVVMCENCFNMANSLSKGDRNGDFADPLYQHDDIIAEDNDSPEQLEVVALNPFGSSNAGTHQGALVEDYTQNIYFTRETCAASSRIGLLPVSQQPLGRLNSYGPTDSMLFTLKVDTTYFDIPGRAPRWGSHSGTDYHGTWLPQTVRRALLRYTRRGERVLSNFLGRGTDAIECFLLSRKCIGVDINPSAVSLSQRNCSFTILPELNMSVEFRPVIMQGDARNLCSSLWPGADYFAEDESFDHILSHPPYKDCVLYSTNIEGDLSRFPGPEEFQKEMDKVIAQSWRLLKTGRHVTLGIGDNRAECFYIPVSYQLIRSYICNGFELDELLVKRQRYCQAFGLGTYLCVQFDFLMFTHEFIATLRKVPKDRIDLMYLTDEGYAENASLGFHYLMAEGEQDYNGNNSKDGRSRENRAIITNRQLREVPVSPIARKSVVMGSVWTFGRHPAQTFPHLCMSRMVERFGRDESNWEQIDVDLPVVGSHLPIQMNVVNPEAAGSKARNSIDSNIVGAVDNCMDKDNDNDADSAQSGSENSEFHDNGTHAGDYEKARQRQIQENREQLLHLGLVSELGEDTTDIAHYLKMTAMPPRLPVSETPLALIVVPHVPNVKLVRSHISPYRQALVQITHDASRRLCPSGLLVLGVQDVRDEHGKLWPLGMLVLEDVQRAVGTIRLRLKEFIVVIENGHARKRDDVISRDSFADERCIVGIDSPDIHVQLCMHIIWFL